jgi:hypothetical protein
LRDVHIDVTLIRLPVEAEDRLGMTVHQSEPAVAIMAAGHPLTQRDALRMDDLARSQFVAVPNSAGVTLAFCWRRRTAGLRPGDWLAAAASACA